MYLGFWIVSYMGSSTCNALYIPLGLFLWSMMDVLFRDTLNIKAQDKFVKNWRQVVLGRGPKARNTLPEKILLMFIEGRI